MIDAEGADKKNTRRHCVHFLHNVDFVPILNNLFKTLNSLGNGLFSNLGQSFKLAFVEGWRDCLTGTAPICSRFGK